mmetsp:Transcript_7616/g.22262  ORF Transcript_7616/g.22262 Transcript_7616/m.22262 type:complete len:203 (-) Transcript_7616:8-616(-)
MRARRLKCSREARCSPRIVVDEQEERLAVHAERGARERLRRAVAPGAAPHRLVHRELPCHDVWIAQQLSKAPAGGEGGECAHSGASQLERAARPLIRRPQQSIQHPRPTLIWMDAPADSHRVPTHAVHQRRPEEQPAREPLAENAARHWRRNGRSLERSDSRLAAGFSLYARERRIRRGQQLGVPHSAPAGRGVRSHSPSRA